MRIKIHKLEKKIQKNYEFTKNNGLDKKQYYGLGTEEYCMLGRKMIKD